MRLRSLSRFLSGCIVVVMLSCSRADDGHPTLRSTDRVARIVQTIIDSTTTASGNISDTLYFYKLADGYHRISQATDTKYGYDEQGRLITQTIDAYRNDGDYGHEVKHLIYDFGYTASALTVTRMGSAKTGAGIYSIPAVRQLIPMNKQEKVVYPPTMPGAFYWSDNGIAGIFSNAIYPLSNEDTLRVYNAEGYLIQTESVTNRYRDRTWIKQTITNGNVERTDFMRQEGQSADCDPAVSTTLLYHHQYDKSKPGLRNPHQFLGNTNRNLPTKTMQTNPTNGNVHVTTYRYVYDSKSRVTRYIISAGSYITVGDITY